MTQKIYDIRPPGKASSGKRRNGKENKKKRGIGFFASLFTGLILISAIVFFFSFRVEIDIWPATEGIELEEVVEVDISVDNLDEKLPGTIFETDFLEDYREFEATGIEESPTEATGMIIIQNNHWDQNQPLVEGTRFEAENGKIFRSKDGILVPGRTYQDGESVPGEVEVEVIADEPGSEYNIEPTEFTLPGLRGAPSYEGVTAISESQMTGGAVGERKVISEEDVENAREEVISSLIEEGRSILEEGRSDKYLLEESSQYGYEIQQEEISGEVGESVDSFSVKIRARIDVLTFEEDHFDQFLISKILDRVEGPEEGGLEAEKLVYEDSLSFNYKFMDIDWNEGLGELDVEFAGEVYSGINESRLIDRAKGSSRDEVKALLEREDFIREARVRFKPFGLGNIPENSDRIRMDIKF